MPSEVERERAEMHAVLTELHKQLTGGGPRQPVTIEELQKLGPAALRDLEMTLSDLPGGPNPVALAKLQIARKRAQAASADQPPPGPTSSASPSQLCLFPSAGGARGRGIHHGA